MVEVEGQAPGFLVLADVWFPGWSCTVDGRPASLYRANFLFQAVALPTGAREVRFTFAPASYSWGKVLSGAALAVVALALLALPLAPKFRTRQGEVKA